MGEAFSLCTRSDVGMPIGPPCGDGCDTVDELNDYDLRDASGRAEESVRFKLEDLMKDLFMLHDLNGNGVLEEVELVKLNEKVAILHHGRDTDRGKVRDRYQSIFRNLSWQGEPINYETFREYMFTMLDGLDPDAQTQAMILEHLIAEADMALAAFPASLKMRPGMLGSLLEAPSSPQKPAEEGHSDRRRVSPRKGGDPGQIAKRLVMYGGG